MKISLDARFINSIRIDQETGCWLWQFMKSHNGYGLISVGGKTQRAHRLAFEKFYHKIPDKLVLDHVCKVRHCVNPTHLRMVTAQQNVSILGRKEKPFCKNGHLLAGDNLAIKYGARVCKACARKHSGVYYYKKHPS